MFIKQTKNKLFADYNKTNISSANPKGSPFLDLALLASNPFFREKNVPDIDDKSSVRVHSIETFFHAKISKKEKVGLYENNDLLFHYTSFWVTYSTFD